MTLQVVTLVFVQTRDAAHEVMEHVGRKVSFDTRRLMNRCKYGRYSGRASLPL